mmetsp:Transcript_3078/g.5428  ORF Transcript_3078/g.5428 Transcript_3078/m.5428 type:complete len:85 (+) Transcript_3078:241-495(+)
MYIWRNMFDTDFCVIEVFNSVEQKKTRYICHMMSTFSGQQKINSDLVCGALLFSMMIRIRARILLRRLELQKRHKQHVILTVEI